MLFIRCQAELASVSFFLDVTVLLHISRRKDGCDEDEANVVYVRLSTVYLHDAGGGVGVCATDWSSVECLLASRRAEVRFQVFACSASLLAERCYDATEHRTTEFARRLYRCR